MLNPPTLSRTTFCFGPIKGISDDMAYKVAKVMHTQEKQLKEGGPLWRSFSSDKRLIKDQGHPYHPGAVKYYKEAGLM